MMEGVDSNLDEDTATVTGEAKDRQSVGTSTLLDSPSTKAMMDRLLAAPDYFSGPSPSGLEALDDEDDDDDDDDVSSGSLKFARGDIEDEDQLLSRRVREQRDKAKVKKLLGTDDSMEDFSRPQYVQGFWSDPDTGLNEIKMRRKASAGSGIPRAQGRSPGVKVISPRDARVPSNSVSSPTTPSRGYGSPREQGAMNITRKSEEGRTQSRQMHLNATPPVSPPWNYHPSPASRTRVPALDSLDPVRSSGSIKRSKTISGAIDCAPPSPPESGGYLQPPPRVSSKNALSSTRLSKRRSSRSPSPNVILTPQSNAPTPLGSPKNQREFSPRVRSSKVSKSMSSFKPLPPTPTASPAGAIAEQYKRQIRETQDAAQTSVKERRRLSALKWMIEQTKSVTGGGKSSPASSSKSASPRLIDAKASSPAVASKLSKDDSSPRSTGPARLDTGVPPLPSPFSATTNESSVSLTLPETSRLARTSSRPGPGPAGRGIRNDGPRSLVLGGFADSPGRSSSSFALPRSPATDEHFSEEFGGAAYCAVVGAHVGHWNSSSATRTQRSSTSKPSGKEKSSFSLSIGRRLSKKKRSNGPEVVEAGPSSKVNQDGIPRNRPRGRSVLVSEREKGGGSSGSSGNARARRGQSLEKAPPLRHRRSLRLSIDKFADEGASPSAPGLAQRTHSSPARSHPSKKPSASGSHFWKLVKRIGSSGGLRDKYQANDGAYVPLSQAPSFSAVSPEVDGNEVLTQLPSPYRRPSLDGSGLTSRVSKATAAPTRKRSTSFLKQASASSADGHISNTRPPQHSSINTRSSTPASDHPSRVYHRTHSTRSSASSFADLASPPPLPNPPSAFLGQRTFGSRSDGGHSSDSGHPTRPSANKSSPLTASSNQRTPTDEDRMALDLATSFQTPPSLPTPPRRPKPVVLTSFPSSSAGRGDYSDIESESPVIPEFSVNNAINQFKPRKQSGDDVNNVNSNPLGTNAAAQNTTQSLEAFPVLPPMMITPSTSVPPPPRPARDARRPTPSSADGGGGPGSSSRSTTGTGPTTTRKDSGLDSDSNTGQQKPHSSSGSRHSSSNHSQHAGYTGYGSKPPTSAFGPSPLFSKTHQQPGVSEDQQQYQLQHQNRAPPLPKRSDSSSPAAPSPSTSIGSTSSPVYRDPQSASSSLSPRTSGVALSEREKAERWNELLERSEKAGGTLRVSLANNIDSHLSPSPISTPTSAVSSGMMDFK
ncbi:hypothetical protein MD484_g6806, partial [Candolleomyces efflorescens]